jgi:hypothetical protein
MKQINIRLLSGEIWAVLGELRQRNDLEVEQSAFIRILDISMAVMARHEGEVLVNDEQLPVSPWPNKSPPPVEV